MTKGHRKIDALKWGLLYLLALAAASMWGHLSEGALSSLVTGLGVVFGIFVAGNGVEHGADAYRAVRVDRAPPPTRPFPSAEDDDE